MKARTLSTIFPISAKQSRPRFGGNNVVKKSIWALVLAVTFLPFTAQGAFVNLIAQTSSGAAGLDGASEVPSVLTGASGGAGMVFNTDTNEFSWAISFQDLESVFTMAHFHGPARVGEPGPIVLSIEPTSRMQGDGVLDRDGFAINNFAADGMSGSLLGLALITADEAGDLLAGLWYINIHSVENGSGEIRGQVIGAAPIPLPAAAWLFISAIGLLGFGFKRRASM